MKRWFLLFIYSVFTIYSSLLFSQPQSSQTGQQPAVINLDSVNAAGANSEDSMLDELEITPETQVGFDSNEQRVAQRNYADLRIGFINFRRIMASIPQLQSVSSTLDREFSQQTATLASKQQELTEMEKVLSNMSRGDAYSDYEKQVIAKRRDYVRDEAAYRDAYSVRRNEELAKLQRIVVDEIVALAKESEYDVILNDTGVIYVSEDADLTSIVIDRLRAIGE